MGEDQVERRLAAILAPTSSAIPGSWGSTRAEPCQRSKRIAANWSTPRSPSIRVGSSSSPVTACWSSSRAWSMRWPAPPTSSTRCASVMPTCRRIGASSSASASTSATSSSRATTSSATASTSRRGSRASPEPGGVAVSGSVRDSVGNRLDLTFDDPGEQTLKNIERPVRVYNVTLSGASRQPASAPVKAEPAATAQAVDRRPARSPT